MTIYFNGHDYKYELEAVIKLFVQCRTFDMRYDVPIDTEEYILTEKTTDGENATLSVQLKLLGEEFTASKTVKDETANCERGFAILLYAGLSKIKSI